MAPAQLTEICSAFFGLCHKIENMHKFLGEFFKIKSPLIFLGTIILHSSVQFKTLIPAWLPAAFHSQNQLHQEFGQIPLILARV